MIHSTEHWVGTDWQRCFSTAVCTVLALARERVSYKHVKKLVGKHGFCPSFQIAIRATFQEIHKWLSDRPAGQIFGTLPPQAWLELFTSTCLLGEMDVCLDSPISTRIECFDACPGGHGREWAEGNADLAHAMCRLCDSKFPYTNLSKTFGIELDNAGLCPMMRIELPQGLFWEAASREWGPLSHHLRRGLRWLLVARELLDEARRVWVQMLARWGQCRTSGNIWSWSQ